MSKAKSPVPAGYHTVTPTLTMENAASAIDWYKKAFGASETSRMVGPDEKIMHASIRVGDSARTRSAIRSLVANAAMSASLSVHDA